MSRLTGFTTALGRALLLSLVAASALAQDGELSVKLTEPDENVNRAVTVTRADNTQVSAVLSIAAYDAAAKTFIIETARQGTLRVPAAGIGELAFVQSPRESSPMAQTCPSTVTVTPGPETALRVPAASLRIEQGRLVLKAADVPMLELGAALEVQRIAYDRGKDLFTVSLQQVTYEVKMQGCGGGGVDPGASKPLQ